MRHWRAQLLLVTACALVPRAHAAAQRDSAVAARRAASPGIAPDSLRPPLSPGRALLYSMVLPGYSQAVLGRHKAATFFLLAEAVSLAMIRESGADVREARSTANDTVVVSYVAANGSASLVTDSSVFDNDYVRARRAHVEDWTALLVANHLIAGADAFVAANLWDVPVRVGLRRMPSGATALAFSIRR